MEPDIDLQGRAALVTGASRGIGLGIATTLARHGARVVATSRRLADLESVADNFGEDAVLVPADLTRASSLDGLSTAAAQVGGVDILVNNAGAGTVEPAIEVSHDAWERTLELNLTVPFRLAQALYPGMAKKGWGRIVNVASILGVVGSRGNPAYVAAKGGLISLTRALATEWSRVGICVNALAPGWTRTDMMDGLMSDDRFARWVERQTPVGRAAEVRDLVPAALFLSSPACRYVTGQVLVVDGGFTIQ